MLRKKKGQNTLEYIIILTLVVGVVAAFVFTMKQDPSSTGVGQLMNKSATKIGDSSGEILNMTK